MSRIYGFAFAVSLVLLTVVTAGGEDKGSRVEGFLIIDDKRIELNHVVAFTGPSPVHDSAMNYLLLSEKPIPADELKKAESPGDLFYAMENGLIVRIEDDSFATLTMRHPALDGGQIRTMVDERKFTENGPERIAGTIKSSGADKSLNSSHGDYEVRYSATFDTPITRHFPLDER